MANAAETGSYLKGNLANLRSAHRRVSDVRGLGLMIGVEFAHDDGKPDAKLRDAVMAKCFEKGLLLLNCGESAIRFCPPLIVTGEEADIAVEIFDSVLAELED